MNSRWRVSPARGEISFLNTFPTCAKRRLCPNLLTFETNVAQSRLYQSRSLLVLVHSLAFFKIFIILNKTELLLLNFSQNFCTVFESFVANLKKVAGEHTFCDFYGSKYLRLRKRNDKHAASLYVPRVDVSCNVSILHYFLERLGQFLRKFWHIFLPRRTLIAIASFEKFRVIPNRFLTHENFILQ